MNQGHRALSCYRKRGERQDLEHSIQQFERALNICSLDHPCRAVVQSNLAMVKLILCQVERMAAPLEDALWLYREALASRPVGHPDRPSTLVHVAVVHFARGQQRTDDVEEAQAEALLNEALGLESTQNYESQAASFMRQLLVEHRAGPVQSYGQPSVEQEATLSLTNAAAEDHWILSHQLLEHFKQFGDLVDLQQAIAILEELVRSISIWDTRYPSALCNLAAAFWHRFNHLGELADLEYAISRLRDAIGLSPYRHPHKLSYLNILGSFLVTRFERLGQLIDLEDAISSQRVWLTSLLMVTPRSLDISAILASP